VRDTDLLCLCAALGPMWRARGGGGTHSLELGNTSSDNGDDGVSCPMGAAAKLERDGQGLRNQLGVGLSFGGVACGVWLATPPTERRCKPSAWTRFTGDTARRRITS
jgi:hypothetical protein